VEATCSLAQHQTEVEENRRFWEAKPVLRKIYEGFHRKIRRWCRHDMNLATVEIGSGLGQIKAVIPHCITTDVFSNPWLDRTENAYRLSFGDGTVANLILFDVWHHLRYPGTAFNEFRRVLAPGGRLIVFEPCMSLLGLIVYGLFHHEPIALRQPITWFAPENWNESAADYYAAAGNAWRTFHRGEQKEQLGGWRLLSVEREAALSYVASGGFRSRQLYPSVFLPFLQELDQVLNRLPILFATRLLVVLEKTPRLLVPQR
jgi:SAM-dependent methyltransferase